MHRGLFDRGHARQVDFEGGATAQFAVDPDISAALLDDAVHSR